MKERNDEMIKGRGAQLNTKNPYLKNEYGVFELEGIDEKPEEEHKTRFYFESPKKVVNKMESPDVGMAYSLNPYQGCEHGCIYCYARNTHQYWGFSAGLDFEQKIIVKKNAPELLRKELRKKNWKVLPIVLSGNTDCYQPAEKKFKITRSLLEVCLEMKHPVSIITKNSLILRDKDILADLQKDRLISLNVSITSLKEELRRKLEPRTASSRKRMEVVKEIAGMGIPVNVMIAPIIPGLNSQEIPSIVKIAAEKGALSAAYTIVRLNGSIADIFKDWVEKAFPNQAPKIIRQIEECHGGQLNDSRFGKRMVGEGVVADQINRLFTIARNKYLKDRVWPGLNTESFTPFGQLRFW
jgi:DNA repair photolyase